MQLVSKSVVEEGEGSKGQEKKGEGNRAMQLMHVDSGGSAPTPTLVKAPSTEKSNLKKFKRMPREKGKGNKSGVSAETQRKRSDGDLMEIESKTGGILKKAKIGVELVENGSDNQLTAGLSEQLRESK